MKVKLKSQHGLTLLGVIIAVFIISAGLVAILGLLTFAISSSQVSKNRIIASFLVQEGMEVVRNIRDTNWLQKEDWNNGIKGTGNESRGIVNYDTQDGLVNRQYAPPLNFPVAGINDIDDCINYNYNGDSPCRLYLDAQGRYSHNSSGTKTNFYRLIKIDKISPDDKPQLKVVSQVKWFERGRWHLMSAEDRLWNWR